jgi:hypothetical protein
VHLHQLQHLLVFKTNYHTPTFIWYPLIWRWNDFTYSIGRSNFIVSTKDHLINQFLYHMYNLLNSKATPTIVWQGVIYPQGTWPVRAVSSPSEQLQISHHKLVSKRNQGVGTVTYSYYHKMEHLFNCYPFVDDRLRQLFKE